MKTKGETGVLKRIKISKEKLDIQENQDIKRDCDIKRDIRILKKQGKC